MKKIKNFFVLLWTASIRRQLMMGIILVHAVLMTIFVFDLVERQRDFLHEQSVQQAKSLSETLSVNSSSWVLANDVIGLEEVMDAQKHYPDLRNAMVLDTRGRILAHTDINKVGLYLNDTISAKLFVTKDEQIILVNNENAVIVASRIVSNGVFIGWARVNLTQDKISKNLKIITQNGLIYTILAIVIGALFAFFMAKGITQGLQQIVDVAEGIKRGEQGVRAKITRRDEIGTLGRDINIMLDTIDKSKRDLQGIMDNSPTVIYVKDTFGHFTYVNKQFEKLFHIKREKVIGKTLFDIFPQEIAEEMYRNDKDVLKCGYALESEESAPQDDGTHVYTSVKFPLYDDQNNIYAVCGISSDITERLKMAEEKSSLETQLLHTQKIQAIGQLTGGVAHDFNNLLAVILGYTELSQSLFGIDNEELSGYLKEVDIAGQRGRELIKQMMIYSRKDQAHSETEILNVDTIVKETASMLRATMPAGINIETSVTENTPHVEASSSLISQILMNLCINAKDGMGKEGDLFISLESKTYSDKVCSSCHEFFSGDYVSITIKDNGKGIDADILSRIFEPFFTTKQVGEGTGMGLSVVHGAIHKLGGHIYVESTVGEGTSFEILLPASQETRASSKPINAENINHNFSDLNIMVVDDEPAVASLLGTSLEACKATVKIFNDSSLALAFFEENAEKIDLVITDQTMPNLTGIALSEKLLALRSDIKIILCTGHSADVTEESALERGVKKFIYKPVKIADLYNVINELM